MKRRSQRARKRRKDRRGPARRSRGPAEVPHEIDLVVRHPELAHAPVHIDAFGMRVPDPYASLGLDPATPASAAAVQAAFRAALTATPPEKDPQRARECIEARDRLLAPAQALTRVLGDLRVPRAEAFVPGHGAPSPTPPRGSQTSPGWSSRSRLVAILTLYALLEDELETGGDPGPTSGKLFD